MPKHLFDHFDFRLLPGDNRQSLSRNLRKFIDLGCPNNN